MNSEGMEGYSMQDTAEKIIGIIKENFPNGIRNDFIDISKVLRIYSANYDGDNISRNFIVKIIRANGIENGGRFYFLSDVASENIRHFFNDLLSKNPIVYYSAAYERHADFFISLNVFAPEVLKKILQETGGHFYFDEFCAASRAIRLDYEVARIFMTAGKALSLDDLQSKLPYVPAEKIYLPTVAGKFIPVSKVQFDADEINEAKQQISFYVERNGCAAPEDYDLSSNFALNPELAERDLLNIIHDKFLSADFVKRGKKFFKKGDAVKRIKKGTLLNHLREFIAEQKELPIEKLFAFAQSLEIHPSAALYCTHEQMVRVDKDLFIKDTLITFDVDGVDEALTSFVQGKIIPLRGVTSFTGFPPVAGYSWNLFLLESFLRKFSRQYVYATPAANNVNAGAIYPKSMKFEDYLDVQAAVIVQEKVPLEISAVEEFLVSQGFRAMRIKKVTERIITRAQEFLNS